MGAAGGVRQAPKGACEEQPHPRVNQSRKDGPPRILGGSTVGHPRDESRVRMGQPSRICREFVSHLDARGQGFQVGDCKGCESVLADAKAVEGVVEKSLGGFRGRLVETNAILCDGNPGVFR